MSEVQRLKNAILDSEADINRGIMAMILNAMLEAHARELAEKIRAWQDQKEAKEQKEFGFLDHETVVAGGEVRDAANLIDPGVNR